MPGFMGARSGGRGNDNHTISSIDRVLQWGRDRKAAEMMTQANPQAQPLSAASRTANARPRRSPALASLP